MNSITEILENSIIPAIYQNIDTLFPEFGFKRITTGYISTTSEKITGENGQKGKVYIYDNNPSFFIDYTRGNKSIWKYIQEKNNLTNQETLIRLAELANVTLPKNNEHFLDNQEEQKTQLLEDLNSFFITSLHQLNDNHPILKYLSKRAFSKNEIELMGIGFVPSHQELFSFLNEKNQNENLYFQDAIGSTHQISIPYRDAIGNIRGFVFRTIDENVTPKYLYSKSLKRNDILFNLKAVHKNHELIIVEGILDSLHANVKGISNVVALGGTSLNEEQVHEAVKRGTKRFTLCLDNDESGKIAILRAIYILKKSSKCQVYVAQLPDGIKDPDQLIKEQGIEVFNSIIEESVRDFKYLLELIINKYKAYGNLSDKELYDFIEEIHLLGYQIENTLDREIYIFNVNQYLEHLNISQKTSEDIINELRSQKIEKQQQKELQKVLQNVQELNNKGLVKEAISLLDKQSKQLNTNTTDSQFDRLLNSTNEEEIKKRMANKPTSLKTDIKIQDEDLLLPSGAISIFAAPTSHGKTTLLVNLALNVALNYSEKQVYFFSFEEDSDSILTNALNTFIGKDLCKNNRRAIRHYYSHNDDMYLGQGTADFHHGRKAFFNQLIHNNQLNIHYTDYTIETLIEAIYYLKENTNIGAIFIDYMQLLRKGKGKYNSRQEELKQICLELKDVAIETGLPIVLGAQFNREVTHHLKVHSTNIGEAGDIERIANLIVGFWNNDFQAYGKDVDMKEIIDLNLNLANTIYMKILKNRAGRVGIHDILTYQSNSGKIINRIKSMF